MVEQQKRNAIIMAAGTSSRFVPLSHEIPKGLLEVKGEILIERQICQLHEAGITDITIVVGYMADKFTYLKNKYDVNIVFNEDYSHYNNTSSLIRVLNRLENTYICSSDNYFSNNVFTDKQEQSYYSALYTDNNTEEYCIQTDSKDNIIAVTIGGAASWYMIGHAYFSKNFSDAFKNILSKEYTKEEVRLGYWEDVYIRHLNHLPAMRIRKYNQHDIEEFDSLDELRAFDCSYIYNTRSKTLKHIAHRMGCGEDRLNGFKKIQHSGNHLFFSFDKDGETYIFNEMDGTISRS